MAGNSETAQLLRCLINVVGRSIIPEDGVRAIIGKGEKQSEAYNLCDGSRTQTSIQKEVGLDQGYFRRLVKKWMAKGILFRIDADEEAKLLHLYPLSQGTEQVGNA